MEIINRIPRMAAITAKTLVTDVKIGLVSTSGAINPGQLALIQTARKMADLVVVSIFVNRLEFSNEDDYRQHPRDITADVDLLRPENVDYVFIPPEGEMYPPNFSSYVEVRKLTDKMAGLPSFLSRGLATNTLKMLHLTKPAYTFYGEPEALQGVILRKMVGDLNISTEVVIAPVPRESSGLAYSGRNRLLTEVQSAAALVFYRSLRAAENAIASGETHTKRILAEISRVAATEPLAKLEYAVIADPELLEPVSRVQGTVMIAVGGTIGNVFLTDAILAGKSRGQEKEPRSQNVP
jgi:pantoate--beta-alanine ligase